MRPRDIPLASLTASANNTRQRADTTKSAVADLAASIREHGLLQPLVVTRASGGEHRILAGHRRYAALRSLKEKSAPCIVMDVDDDNALAVLVTDNAQHRAVDALKEAEAVNQIVQGLSEERHPHDRASTMLGRSVAWIRARLRLTTLSGSWRKAFADADHPISQFPVGHLELIAALSESIQEHAFTQWEGWWDEGVPLHADIKRMVAEFTCDLGDVPWDTEDDALLDDAPACAVCPKKDSVQGDLFQGLGGSRGSKADRCLDATCFEAKKRAAIYRSIDAAKEKYGDKLRLEIPWSLRDVPMPSDLKVHAEHNLSPLTKAKGGVPVLRMRTMKVAYMGKSSQATQGSPGDGTQPLLANGVAKPKPLEERREGLHRRRLVRALDLLQGSLMNRLVHVGTAKHPEEVVPPEPSPPSLDDLITYVLVYGTGPSVDPDGDGYDAYGSASKDELDQLAKETSAKAKSAALRTRARLWNRVREPLARSLRTFSGMSLNAAERAAGTAGRVCKSCGLDWDRNFVAPATEWTPEPASWAKLNEDGTPKRRRATS